MVSAAVDMSAAVDTSATVDMSAIVDTPFVETDWWWKSYEIILAEGHDRHSAVSSGEYWG